MKPILNRPRNKKPIVGILMASKTDWETMQRVASVLDQFQIPYEVRVLSAPRTRRLLASYAKTAEKRGLKIIIAGAGAAAHFPALAAAYTVVPVIGVRVQSKGLKRLDPFPSIIRPLGIPVACTLMGPLAANHASHLAVKIVAGSLPDFRVVRPLDPNKRSRKQEP